MASQEAANEARSKANHAFARKRYKALLAANVDDGLELKIWRFEECTDLWKTVQLKQEEYISKICLIKMTNNYLRLKRTG